MDYKGYEILELNEEETAHFYEEEKDKILLKENEYLGIKNKDGEIFDKFCFQDGVLRPVRFHKINNIYCGDIKPRNFQQQLAFDLLNDRKVPVKIIKGVYGSGKDYLMLNKALELIEKGHFEKIIFIRPNVTIKDVPDIGFLPGDAYEKLAWALAPFYDKVGGEEGIQILVSKNKLELVPLPFIRGRSFDHSIVYVCEGQNITTEIAKLLISRIGENSELWINADTHQTDNKKFDNDNGITAMIDKLSGNKLFGYVYLPKTERSAVAELATLLD